jgi:hypothetical protein
MNVGRNDKTIVEATASYNPTNGGTLQDDLDFERSSLVAKASLLIIVE